MGVSSAAEIGYLPVAPQADLDLDLRRCRGFVARDDGDLVLVVTDGECTVSLEPGLGHQRDCIATAEQLAAAALSYAELMRAKLDDESSAGPAGPAAKAREEHG